MSDPLRSDVDPSLSTFVFLASSRHRIEILNRLRVAGSAPRRSARSRSRSSSGRNSPPADSTCSRSTATSRCTLGLVDDAVDIGSENDEGIPRALFRPTDDRLRAWGEETFEEYVAEPLSEETF